MIIGHLGGGRLIFQAPQAGSARRKTHHILEIEEPGGGRYSLLADSRTIAALAPEKIKKLEKVYEAKFSLICHSRDRSSTFLPATPFHHSFKLTNPFPLFLASRFCFPFYKSLLETVNTIIFSTHTTGVIVQQSTVLVLLSVGIPAALAHTTPPKLFSTLTAAVAKLRLTSRD